MPTGSDDSGSEGPVRRNARGPFLWCDVVLLQGFPYETRWSLEPAITLCVAR